MMSEPPATTAFIVDDDADLRDSLQFLIQSVGIDTETFDSAAGFIEGFDPARSGCVICDVRMPEMSGLDLFERLKGLGSQLPVILMTAYADVPMAIRAMKLGAAEFIEKPFSGQVMLEAIQRAMLQDHGRRAAQDAWSEFSARIESLTEKEKETLSLILTGAPNKAIAARLQLTERAVEVRRASIMKKLEAQTFAELVRLVTQFELLFPERRIFRTVDQI